MGVVSDSHDNLDNVDKAINVLRERGVRIVFHLGDYVAPFTLLRFINAGLRVIGVFGNNDGERLGLARVASINGSEIHDPPHQVFIRGKKILLIHGVGPAERTRELVESLASSKRYDAILYGHTHFIDNRVVGDTLVLNPGELYGKLSGRASLAILNLRDLSTEIIIL